MHVNVRFFAVHREALGRSSYAAELPEGCTVAAAYRALCDRFPQLRQGEQSIAFARNQEHVDNGVELVEGDELAILPPVAGG